MLNVDPSKRLTIDQVMKNVWIAVRIHTIRPLNCPSITDPFPLHSNTQLFRKHHCTRTAFYAKVKRFGQKFRKKWQDRWPQCVSTMTRFVAQCVESVYRKILIRTLLIFRCTSRHWITRIIRYWTNVANVPKNKHQHHHRQPRPAHRQWMGWWAPWKVSEPSELYLLNKYSSKT